MGKRRPWWQRFVAHVSRSRARVKLLDKVCQALDEKGTGGKETLAFGT